MTAKGFIANAVDWMEASDWFPVKSALSRVGMRAGHARPMAFPFGVNRPEFFPWAVNSLRGGVWRRFGGVAVRGVETVRGWAGLSLKHCRHREEA